MTELVKERMELALERIKEIENENLLSGKLQAYARTVAGFLLMVEEHRQWVLSGAMEQATLEELQERNYNLYRDILPENYEHSFGNPEFAVKELGETGKVLSALYAELRANISETMEEEPVLTLLRWELFLEMYGLLAEGRNVY